MLLRLCSCASGEVLARLEAVVVCFWVVFHAVHRYPLPIPHLYPMGTRLLRLCPCASERCFALKMSLLPPTLGKPSRDRRRENASPIHGRRIRWRFNASSCSR